MPNIQAGPNTKMNTKYFSGTQSSLFIGDVWVDDVVNYTFRVEHSRTPVYGYGSQHYDFIPKGTILVMGEFTINFREPNYLWLIIERYKKFNKESIRSIKNRESGRENGDRIKKIVENNIKTFGDDPRANIDMFLAAKAENASLIRDRLDQSFDTRPTGQTREYWNHDSFNMIFGYGDSTDETIGERLNGIQLMGKARVVQADGTPIQETYSFIGRDFR